MLYGLRRLSKNVASAAASAVNKVTKSLSSSLLASQTGLTLVAASSVGAVYALYDEEKVVSALAHLNATYASRYLIIDIGRTLQPRTTAAASMPTLAAAKAGRASTVATTATSPTAVVVTATRSDSVSIGSDKEKRVSLPPPPLPLKKAETAAAAAAAASVLHFDSADTVAAVCAIGLAAKR